MAAKGITLPILFKADDKGIKNAQNSLGGLGKSLVKVGALIAGAFGVRAITRFAKESLAVAEASATAQAKLEAVANATGVFGDATAEVTDRLGEFAKSQEMRIAVDQNVIKGVQAQLLAFKGLSESADEQGGTFDRVTAAVFDMSSVFGSADGATKALGKAMEDPSRNLTVLAAKGVVFTKQQEEQIRAMQESGDILGAQAMVLDAVEGRFEGVAEATADASDQLALAGKNIKQNFGDALLPVFNDLVKGLLPVFETIGETLGDTVTEMQPMLQDLAEQIPGLLDAFVPLIPAIASIAGLFIELIAAALPFITDILDVLLPIIGDLVPLLMDAISTAFEPLMEAFMSLVDALLPLVAEFLPIFAEIIAELAPLFADLIAEIAPMIAELLPPLVELFFELIDVLKPIIEKLLPVIMSLFDAFAPLVMSLIEAFMPLLEKVLPFVIGFVEILIPILETMAHIFGVILVAAIGFFVGAFEKVQSFFEKFGPIFENIFIGLHIVFASVINGLIAGFENFINFFVRGFNLLLSGINLIRRELDQSEFNLVGEVSFGRVEVPKLKPMAIGGIVTGPTAALIGEAGPEAVIPLDRFDSFKGGGGDVYNITINANVADARLGEVVVNAIKRFERSSGPVFASA